jgi:hypothetical protein
MALLIVTAVAYDAPAIPAVNSVTLVSQSIVSGSAVTMGNSCSRMIAAIGQPVSGYSSGGGFGLSAGFIATVPASSGDAIFFDGFEGCKP